MATLLTPSEYEAVIVSSQTQLPLTYLPWSSIKWQRVRNEVSEATVVVAEGDGGIECCGAIGGLVPWSQMLRIERNGDAVWDGPIVGWDRPGNTRDLTIVAADRSAMMWKRLIATARSYTSQAPYTIINQLMTDASLTSGYSTIPYPLAISTATPPAERVTRQYYVERLERLYDVVKELCENTLSGFWTCVLGNIFLDELTNASVLGLGMAGRAPKLNEVTTIGLPGVHVDGRGMATYNYAAAAGQGINGFPLSVLNTGALNLVLASQLQKAAPSDRTGNTTDLTLLAGRSAAESAAPDLTIEQIRLSPEFGNEFMTSDLANLYPGAQVDIDYEETCAFNVPIAEYREAAGVAGIAYTLEVSMARLDQLDVTVSKAEGGGIDEQVLGSFRPIITNNIASASGLVDQGGTTD